MDAGAGDRQGPSWSRLPLSSARYLVIGSNSFSGASFVARLLDEDCAVVGISRSPEPHPVFLPYRWRSAADRFSFHRLDLNRDLEAIDHLLHDWQPEYVVNFAAQSMVAQSWDHPDHWFTTNVVATVRLHDRLRACKFLRRYVHVSTPEVYGNCTGSVTEDAPFNPSTPYAVSRAAADMSLRTYFAAYHFPVVFTRAANVYGAGQQLYRIVPRAVLSGLLGRRLQLHGGGTSVRSFIHAADVAEGTLRVAREGTAGSVYHISTERTISIRDLVALVAERLGVGFGALVDVAGERLGKDSAYLLDSGRLRRELGWRDVVSLESGIEGTIAWARKHLSTLEAQPWEYEHKP